MEAVRSFELSEGRIKIRFHVMRIGCDYLVIIEGGEVPHIGSITLAAEPADDSGRPPVESMNGHGHKEYVITEAMAKQLQNDCEAVVAVIGGVHMEAIEPGEIRCVVRMCEAAGEQIRELISSGL